MSCLNDDDWDTFKRRILVKDLSVNGMVLDMLDVSVILFNKVVQVFTLPDGNGLFIWFTAIECRQHSCICVTLYILRGDYFRFAMVTYGAF